MRRIALIITGCIIYTGLFAQTLTEVVEGTVSYITSQNIYVKFSSTDGLIEGDTLFKYINDVQVPVLEVIGLSSKSVLCSKIGNISLILEDVIIAHKRKQQQGNGNDNPIVHDTVQSAIDTLESIINTSSKSGKGYLEQRISGSVRISNYSNFSNTPAHYSSINRLSAVFRINNIGNSRFSFETNFAIRLKDGELEKVKQNVFEGLKIYTLFFKCDLWKNSFVSVGRSFNRNISNIGAMDGLQFEKAFRGFFIGAFAGSRPHFEDYGFNFNLLQYGVYMGYRMQTSKRNMENSLAFVEQMNNLRTDRRFIYFQHYSYLLKDLSLFLSADFDLFKIVNEERLNDFSLKNLYVSIRYRPIKKLSFSGSYDARNNVIYYETDKNYLSTLIEKETRQGVGLYTNYWIAKYLTIGFRAGYRFQKSDIKPTRNAYLFLTYSNIIRSKISATISSTILETNYLQGNIISIRLSRPFISNKMNINCGYSFVNYKISNLNDPFRQNIGEIGVSVDFLKKLSFALNFEADFERENKFYRSYIQLRVRF